MKGFFRNAALAGIFSAFLLGGSPVTADEITPKPVVENNLEEKVSEPKIKINFNFGEQSEREAMDYLKFYSKYHCLNEENGTWTLFTDFFNLSSHNLAQKNLRNFLCLITMRSWLPLPIDTFPPVISTKLLT